jgi:hypothetical protein
MYDFLPPISERQALFVSRSLIVAGLIGLAVAGVEHANRTGGIGSPSVAVLVSFGGLLLAGLFVVQKITGRLHFASAAILSFLFCLISLWVLPNALLFRWVVIGALGIQTVVFFTRFVQASYAGK